MSTSVPILCHARAVLLTTTTVQHVQCYSPPRQLRWVFGDLNNGVCHFIKITVTFGEINRDLCGLGSVNTGFHPEGSV